MKTLKILIFGITFLLISCSSFRNSSNPFKLSMRTVNDIKLKKSKHVTIYDYSEENIKYFLNNGYIIKAKSAFRNRLVNISGVELAAKEIGSDVALYKREYAGTTSGVNVISWYVPGETYTVKSSTIGTVNASGYGNATIVGSNGYEVRSSSSNVNGTYKSNTKTTIQGPGKYENYSVPYSFDYYNQYAVFLVKDEDVLDSESKNTKKVVIGKNFKTKYKIPIDSDPITTGSRIIGYIPKNKNILVIEKVNLFFYKIEYKNKIGYIRTDWIDD